ncbi:MAG TPA: holo-ACP synthase [bacterium]|jgi:holo-[acyl-carrier protein] synthase|nr:holo-ACP synthase [bacterium]
MIVGLGVDLIEIDRVKSAHLKHGQRFIDRLFTPGEAHYCLRKKDPYPSLAGRFAVKEAVIKAFGHGFGGRWKWTQIEVVREPSGKPTLKLTGIMEELRTKRNIDRVHLTIAHSKRDATATVIFESSKAGKTKVRHKDTKTSRKS